MVLDYEKTIIIHDGEEVVLNEGTDLYFYDVLFTFHNIRRENNGIKVTVTWMEPSKQTEESMDLTVVNNDTVVKPAYRRGKRIIVPRSKYESDMKYFSKFTVDERPMPPWR